MESEGILPFSEVKLHHEPDGPISTSVYRKATYTLDFSSHNPLPHKRAVISTLLNRAKTHSSSNDARATEEEHVSLSLQWNGYPKSCFVNTLDLLLLSHLPVQYNRHNGRPQQYCLM